MRIISVAELTRYLKEKLDSDSLLSNIWVKGEISNFKQSASGHVYFTLKDDISCLKTVMFRSRVNRLLFQPANGMAVTIRGYISVYERDGSYQLYAEEMEPDGLGALHLAFEQLKEKLQAEGLFDPACKRKLPSFPDTVALITSPTGAALRDMIKIINKRWPGTQLVLVPVLVQGENAAADICRGLEQVNRWGKADVVIVGRGGGSLEELWAFNTELVARAVAASKIPVVSAVGHQTDYTICDFAADARAATPSAAAEMVVPSQEEMKRYLHVLHLRAQRAVRRYVGDYRRRLTAVRQSKVLTAPHRVFLDGRRQYTDMLQREMIKNVQLLLAQKGRQLGNLAGALQSLSPLATLARGYSLCTDAEGGIISSAEQVSLGSKVNLILHQGKLVCTVNQKE